MRPIGGKRIRGWPRRPAERGLSAPSRPHGPPCATILSEENGRPTRGGPVKGRHAMAESALEFPESVVFDSDDYLDVERWREDAREWMGPADVDALSDDEVMSRLADERDETFDAELAMIDSHMKGLGCGHVIARATVGRWNGSSSGTVVYGSFSEMMHDDGRGASSRTASTARGSSTASVASTSARPIMTGW